MADNFKKKFVDRFLEELNKQQLFMKDEEKAILLSSLNKIFDYTPNIGILGKTGVGKSSLCNALFGEKIAKIDDVEACTRNVQEILLKTAGNKGLNLFDVPGVGETEARDQEYANLYNSLLPKLDLIIWVISVNDRAYETDLRFYNTLLKPRLGKVPFLIVINKAELMTPTHQYYESSPRKLSTEQTANIEAKKRDVYNKFNIPMDRIIEVSANEEINLAKLVVKMLALLPPEVAISLANRAVPLESKPGEPAVNIQSTAWKIFLTVVDKVISNIPILGEVYKTVKRFLGW